MEKIPITFEYEGVQFTGHFTKISGGGSSDLYYLTLNGFHYGQLWKAGDKWHWGANAKEMFNEPWMLEFFVGVVEG